MDAEALKTAVDELTAACDDYVGPSDDPSIGWRGTASHPDFFCCEYCRQEHRDSSEIPHTKYCKVVRLIAAVNSWRAEQ